MIDWKLVKKKIKDLKPNPHNPRILTKDQAMQLQTSLDKFGLIEKPIITENNIIISGHQRVNLLKKAKEQEIECWQACGPMEKEDIDELTIRLNKNAGEFDFEMLANAWNVDDLVQWGFNPKEFDILISQDEPFIENNQKSEGSKCPTCGKKSTKG